MTDNVLRLVIVFLGIDILLKLVPLMFVYTKYLLEIDKKIGVSQKLNIHTSGTQRMIISKSYFYAVAVFYKLLLTCALLLDYNFEQKIGYNLSQLLFNGYNIIILIGIKIYSDYYYLKIVKGK